MAQTNYVPDISTPDLSSFYPYGVVRVGVGVPDNADGNNGDLYVNTSNGNVYSKDNDVWGLSTGGSGVPQVYAYTGASPTADAIVPDDPGEPAIAYKKDGTDATYGWNVTTQAWT